MRTKIRSLFLFLTAALLCSCSNTNQDSSLSYLDEVDSKAPVNTLSAGEEKQGWHLLFDGKSTDGWRGYNMPGFPDCWAIEDGALTMNTKGGGEEQDIITEEVYDDFALFLEYKLTPAANSGVIFQVKEDTVYTYSYETGPEFQVIDQLGWPTSLENWQMNGANYAMYPPKSEPFKTVGEWNQLLLVVEGDEVTQILNGEVVVEYTKYSDDWNERSNSGKWKDFPDWGKYDEGHIALQNHGTKVWYRNIKIKAL